MHLTEAERKVMETVWSGGDQTAKEIAASLRETAQWSKTTSYTMITRCVEKGYLRRQDPHFVCSPKVSREDVSHWETDELLNNNFHGSADLLVASLVGQKKLSKKEVEKLYLLLQEIEDEE
ncbi:MAG: BlaI/MecI/CopY family transcriptional regulator [Oscillospiraceae bacterium]|nr:BlaI/MecI/CopY family transcriptional regulator [Oscillospiraceae bacterium]